jgi:sortase A
MRLTLLMLAESRRRRRLAAGACLLLAALFAADAGAIHAKAVLAQWLLQQAWQARSDGTDAPRPWPWADLRPVATLRVPRIGIAQVVVSGDSGRSIAFGPGWAEASAAPGEPGTTVISGHRDTHFSWLRGLRIDDVMELHGARNARRYRVTATTIADAADHRVALDDGSDRLVLVTCWPFDAISSGGSGRYVVTAEACGDCADAHSTQAAAPASP